jgi:exopolysaccharide biosynthesis polyprenyl glycosylphosphotransferase
LTIGSRDRSRGEGVAQTGMTAQEQRELGREGQSYQSTFSIAQRTGPWREALLRRMLAMADAVSALAVSLSLGVVFGGRFAQMLWSALFLPVWLLLAKIHGLYDRDHRALRHLTVDELPAIFIWATMGTSLLALFLAVTPAGALSVAAAVEAWLIVLCSAFVLRAAARMLWRRITPPARTLIVGGGTLATATRRKIELFPDIHVEVVGERDDLGLAELQRLPDELGGIDRVIVASQAIDEELIAGLVSLCRRFHMNLSVIPPVRGMLGTAVQLKHVADLPVVEYNTWDVSRSTLFLKRVLDIAVASIALIVLLPFLVVIGLSIKLDSSGPILFTQLRAGRNGRPFRMRKFRTMVSDAEQQLAELVPFDSLRDPMFKLPQDPRVTRFGRMLRRTSLDELPQLVNVLGGDMSLVGPRPEQVELVDRYSADQLFRLAVKPGMTGPMQVYGRGRLTFEERLAVERDYIENLSVGRDLRILALTLSAVASGRGAF